MSALDALVNRSGRESFRRYNRWAHRHL